jgi:hypothetical protein
MKKTLLFLLTAAIGVSLCAPAQTVTSVNAVGMVKITVPANGGLFLARYDFITDGQAEVSVTSLLGTEVPVGTTIYVWDRANQTYFLPAPRLSQNFLGQKSWTRTDLNVSLGDAFFIKNASGADEFEVVFSGEVPGEGNSNSEITLESVAGFMGFPFPVAVAWTSTQLSQSLPVGAVLYVWDPLTQAYTLPGPRKSQNFLGQILWTANPTILPGHGFWIASDVLPSVLEPKPYLWP